MKIAVIWRESVYKSGMCPNCGTRLLKPDNTRKVLTYGFGGVRVLAGIIQVVAYLMGENTDNLVRRQLLNQRVE